MSAVLPSAAERVSLSREHLRQAMQPAASRQRAANDPLTGEPLAVPWLDRARALPGAAVTIDAVGAWWEHHPMRLPLTLAAKTATSLARPIAEKHPLRLVLGAAAVGGLLAWGRPWRWALKSALFAGLVPQLILSAMKKPPVAPTDRPRLP